MFDLECTIRRMYYGEYGVALTDEHMEKLIRTYIGEREIE